MSLILEALRKLEREKQTPQRGFLVLGPGAWADGGAAGRPIALFLLGLLVGAVALGIVMRPGPAPAASGAAVSIAPTAAAPTPHPARSARPSVLPMPASATASSVAPAAAQSTPAPKPTAHTFTLQAISEKDGHSVALINDRLLRQGDAIDGASVVKISADSVELEIAGRRVVLRF